MKSFKIDSIQVHIAEVLASVSALADPCPLGLNQNSSILYQEMLLAINKNDSACRTCENMFQVRR